MIGDRLKEARESANLSQAQLCELVDVGRAMYSRYETNRTDPYAAALRSLCLGLNVSADYLLGLSPVAERTYPLGFQLPEFFPKEQLPELNRYIDALLTKGEPSIHQRLLRAFDALGADQQELLTALLEGIAAHDKE